MKHNYYKIVFYICIISYFIIGLSVVYLSGLRVTDENWHFAASSLVAQGKLPYRDFAYFHMPLVPYFYGIGMFIFGSNLIVARLISFLLGLLTIIFIYKTARLLKGEYAGIFAMLIVIFNLDIIYNSIFYWGTLENFILSLFCLLLVSKTKPIIKYSLCTALLVLVQGVRYALDYMTIYTLLFVTFSVYLNRENKKAISSIILSYIGTSLIIYLPFLLIAPKAFLFDVFIHYFSYNFVFGVGKSINTTYTLAICIYDRIKMLLILFRNYYVLILLSLLSGIYAFYHYRLLLKGKKTLFSILITHKIYFIFLTLVMMNAIFYLAIFGNALQKFPYHGFPVLAILIGCCIKKILEHFNFHNEKLFFTIFLSAILFLNLFTQDIEGVINSPQYAGVSFLNKVTSAIQRHTQPGEKIFAFINGYVLHAHRQIFEDTVYELSSTSNFPYVPDKVAQEYKLLSPNIILSYFKDKKAKFIVLERPGRLDNLSTLVSSDYKNEIESIINKNYILLEKVYKYPEGVSGPVVYIYKAK
ncbi:MAG: glycosyltransferase family 39 protein [Candidatus Omnitrophota bacterium]